jgi:hypothetical protein
MSPLASSARSRLAASSIPSSLWQLTTSPAGCCRNQCTSPHGLKTCTQPVDAATFNLRLLLQRLSHLRDILDPHDTCAGAKATLSLPLSPTKGHEGYQDCPFCGAHVDPLRNLYLMLSERVASCRAAPDALHTTAESSPHILPQVCGKVGHHGCAEPLNPRLCDTLPGHAPDELGIPSSQGGAVTRLRLGRPGSG